MDQATDESGDGESPEPGVDPASQSSGWKDLLVKNVGLLVIVAAALVMAGFIFGRVTTRDSDIPSATTAATVPALQFPSGDQDRQVYWSYGGITSVVYDTFTRPDDPDSLGRADTGEPWRPIVGAWGLDAGTAALTQGGISGASVAVIPGGNADRITEATLTVVEPGVGLVFRFQNLRNYWSMTASAEGTGWVVTRVSNGEVSVEGEVPGPTTDGTTISVAQLGANLQFFVEGTQALVLDQGQLRQARLSGLLAPEGAAGLARWDRFYIGNMPAVG